jgi:hypothetical protein
MTGRTPAAIALAATGWGVAAAGWLAAPTARAQILEEDVRFEVRLSEETLRRHAPVYVLDSRERHPPASVREGAALAPELAPLVALEPRGPRVYARAVVRARPVLGPGGFSGVRAAWLQYWTFHASNPQDRGIVRTGRHEGDWEVVQVRLDGRLRPLSATYAQHTWAERCPWSRVRRRGAAPLVFVANASHAAYFAPGDHDRPLGDPTDEADGRGARLRPALRDLSSRPRWLAWPGRWGSSRAGIVPGENPSPRGPAFQPASWVPERLEARARPCGSGAPGRWWAWPALIAAVALAGGAAALSRHAWRRPTR